MEEVWASAVARALCAQRRDVDSITVTWINHFSVQRLMRTKASLQSLDYVGVDGQLLRLILRSPTRTSADLVLPRLMELWPGVRVALVGSTTDSLRAASQRVRELSSRPVVVLAKDGYSELPTVEELDAAVRAAEVDLVILGLGAPLQESYLVGLKALGTPGIHVSCGGWLDQFGSPAYYPSWAYRLRLNWLVRLVREPRRLWRRYTVDAAEALLRRESIRRYVAREASSGYKRMDALQDSFDGRKSR